MKDVVEISQAVRQSREKLKIHCVHEVYEQRQLLRPAATFLTTKDPTTATWSVIFPLVRWRRKKTTWQKVKVRILAWYSCWYLPLIDKGLFAGWTIFMAASQSTSDLRAWVVSKSKLLFLALRSRLEGRLQVKWKVELGKPKKRESYRKRQLIVALRHWPNRHHQTRDTMVHKCVKTKVTHNGQPWLTWVMARPTARVFENSWTADIGRRRRCWNVIST